MNGGYIYLPEDMSYYIFRRIISGDSIPERKDGYYNILKNIMNSKKPIVSTYKHENTYTIGYIVGTCTDEYVMLGMVSQLFSGDNFTTLSVGVIVNSNDDVIVLRKTIGG